MSRRKTWALAATVGLLAGMFLVLIRREPYAPQSTSHVPIDSGPSNQPVPETRDLTEVDTSQRISVPEPLVTASQSPTLETLETSSEPKSIFSPDPNVHSLRVLETELEKFKSATAAEKFNHAAPVLCQSIAAILDLQGRTEAGVKDQATRLGSAKDRSTLHSFSFNGSVYRFEDWEFPEFSEWKQTLASTLREHPQAQPAMSSHLAERIEGRAEEAISILKHKAERTPK